MLILSFDGFFIHGLIHELREQILRGRINKVQQPYQHEIILTIRANGRNHKLLLSAHPIYARLQLTIMKYNNPEVPPSFVMVLRKYLEGAILEKIEQIENDRIIHFTFSNRDELGDLQNIVLVVEIMGRHSAIILLDKKTEKIVDAIKHLGLTQNDYRTILPGSKYITPPQRSKKNPFEISDAELFETLSEASEITAIFLQQIFQGLGYDTALELAFRLQQKNNEKIKVWRTFFDKNYPISPKIYVLKDKEFFTPFPFTCLAEARQDFADLNELLEAVFTSKAEKDRVKQQASSILHRVNNELKKNKTKLKKLEATLQETENAEEYRKKGELLTAFMAKIPRGVESVTLDDYYEDNQPLEIALRKDLSPNRNAQKYFQKYQKLKIAVKIVQKQIEQTRQEIMYLESVESQLLLATPLEIPIVKEELQAEGFFKKQNKRKNKREKPSQPTRFKASDGTELLVGRNNLQNDRLTLKIAKKTDLWLHAKNIPGSHVIIRNDLPSEETLKEAANLAAYFSRYRHSANVPVDYVQVKKVKKPSGAKPGFVIYTGQKTVYVTPDKDLVERLNLFHN